MKKFLVVAVLLLSSQLYAQDNLNFSFTTLNGESTSLSELEKEGPVLISFWALWCKPCRVEMRALNEMYKKYKEKGFTILGINQDTPRSIAKVRSYVSSQNIKYPILLDPDMQYFQMLNGQALPYSILYSQEGKVVYRQTGYLPGDEENIEKVLSELLDKKE
jgi:peroxiredoxin